MARIKLAPNVARAVARHGSKPKFDRYARRAYGISGVQLLARLTAGENAGRMGGTPSSAGARGAFQFIPSTRAAFQSQFGIDPWRSANEAARAAVLHLTAEKRGWGGGLAGYNPGGGQGYVDYILSQRTGGVRKAAQGMPQVPGGLSRGTKPSLVQQAPINLAGILSDLKRQPPAVQSAGIAPPEFSASRSLAMPEGYKPVESVGPMPKDTSLADTLKAVSAAQVPEPQVTPGSPGVVRGGKVQIGSGAVGGLGVPQPDGWKGSKSVGLPLANLGKQLGLEAISEKRSTVNTSSGGVSDHYEGNKDAYAWDLSNGSSPTPEMDAAARKIARSLGVKNWRGGVLNVNKTVRGRTYRFQLLYRTNVGGNHYNHVHFGVRRVG